jgi:putative ABC transport system substrate-binding protein
VTGLSIQQTDTAGKRIELFREVVPGLRRLAILANVGSSNAVVDMDEVQAVADAFSLGVIRTEIRRAEDLVSAFETLKGRADALYVCVSRVR